MMAWASQHIEAILMVVGGAFSFGALLWRGASDTQRVLSRLDMIGHRLTEAEKSVRIASQSREKLHGRIDRLAEVTDTKIGEVRERVVLLETKAGQ